MKKVYRILPNDINHIGKQFVTHEGLATVTHVTKDRVIYTNEKGEEGWSWILPNGRASYFVHPEEVEALEIQEAYLQLQQHYEKLKIKYERILNYFGTLRGELVDFTAFEKEIIERAEQGW